MHSRLCRSTMMSLMLAFVMAVATLLSPGGAAATPGATTCMVASPAITLVTPSSTSGLQATHGVDATPVGTPSGSSCLAVTLSSDGIRAGPRTLTVELTEHQGAPVRDARVVLYTRHLEMDHGTSTAEAIGVGPGRYVAEDVSMGMAGHWEIVVEVVKPGLERTTAIFVIELVR